MSFDNSYQTLYTTIIPFQNYVFDYLHSLHSFFYHSGWPSLYLAIPKVRQKSYRKVRLLNNSSSLSPRFKIVYERENRRVYICYLSIKYWFTYLYPLLLNFVSSLIFSRHLKLSLLGLISYNELFLIRNIWVLSQRTCVLSSIDLQKKEVNYRVRET